MLTHAWKLTVTVARYGSQSINDLEDWPISKLVRVSKLLGELIQAENKSGGGSSSTGGGSW